MLSRLQFIVVCSGFLAGCAVVAPRPPLVAPPVAVPVVPATRYTALARLSPSGVPLFEDDLDTASLRTAALTSLSYYQTLPEGQIFIVGSDTYTARDMAESMESLASLLADASSDWRTALKESFVVYQSVGTDPDRTVIFSSYYEPSISARLTKDSTYRYPLYNRPQDLVDVDLGRFDPQYEGARIAGRRQGNNLVPYLTRADIDSKHALSGEGLELAWAKNPSEILDLQIEGSGWLDFGNGDLRRIRYDGNNGRKYRSVGQYLISSGRIPAKTFSREAYLRYLETHPQERQSLLDINERYIFFRMDMSTTSAFAYGNIEVPLTGGRSIATDPKLFPKGALAWIDTGAIKRFMVNQDEGGAIQGPGRVDIFAGHGTQAKLFATHLWNKGKLYFLVKKKS